MSTPIPTRPLGRTGLELPILSFGASSLGQEFRSVTLDEALKSVRVALDCGLNFIDTSPFYGRGMSEVLLGVALKGVPRESYTLCTKLGRYDLPHFDFSARRAAESVDVSLHRLGTDHIDIMLCHDIEFVEMQQIVDETLPALRKIQQQGKVRFIGFSGYPMKIFRFILDQTDVDVALIDIMMPEMDGYETMEEIRKNANFRRLPIIALTAKAMKGDREKCLDAGASDYLAKPVNTEQLLSALRSWLHR